MTSLVAQILKSSVLYLVCMIATKLLLHKIIVKFDHFNCFHGLLVSFCYFVFLFAFSNFKKL